jgi:hypothetical protein
MKIKLVEINKEYIDNEDKTVYDLTVKDDHSYIADNKIVHNCLTTQQTGIGYPMASLIHEIYKDKRRKKFKNVKIVADGGFKKYSDIIKALALGADMVMVGSIFGKALECCSNKYNFINDQYIDLGVKYSTDQYPIDGEENKTEEILNQLLSEDRLYAKFRGMSSKEVQEKWGRKEIKTSEGVVKFQKIEYTLKGWYENFEHYLRSAMSYTNSSNLKEFRGSNFNIVTNASYKRFNK